MIHSAAAFQIYLGALVNTGQKALISPAVRRRDSILAEFPDSTPSTSGTSTPQSQGSSGTTLASGGTASVLPPRPSSQDIAQVVLAGQADLVVPPSVTSSPDLTKLGAVLEASGSASPIQVSIIESKPPQLIVTSCTIIFLSQERVHGSPESFVSSAWFLSALSVSRSSRTQLWVSSFLRVGRN